jgi:DNA-binding beta-propeller fold protein YncE
MKKLLIAAAVLLSTNGFAQHKLEKIWQSDTTLMTPESVLFDAATNTLYVSNIGDFQVKKSGFISKLDLNGKILNRDWVKGLTATKGMGLYDNKLYAAEQNTIAVIDVNTGTILERIPVEGAQFLNDITIDSKGVVYVSDSRAGKIYRIENGKPAVYLENLKNPNGLLSVANDLFILADGVLHKADAQKNLSSLAQAMEGNTDGIVMVDIDEYLVSGWQGVLYYVKADGTKEVLLDTRDQKINTADIGYDAKNKIVYVPTFGKNMVVAYRLK